MTQPDYYAILGIERGATAEEVKAAYRRESMRVHPDRGGNTDAQAAVNRAYEVLSDEVRRALYDATGRDLNGPSVETEAQQQLAQLFGQVVNGSTFDPIADARQILLQARTQMNVARDEAKRKLARLTTLRGKVSTKGDAPNLVHGIIDAQIQAIDQALTNMDRGEAVQQAVSDMLDAYEFTGEQPMPSFGNTFYSPYATFGASR